MASAPGVPTDPVSIAFQNAIREFKDELGDAGIYDEILKTSSIDDVYDLTDKLQAEQGLKGKLRNIRRIEKLLKPLSDFAGVIAPFGQDGSDVHSVLWGPLKLLVQRASAFAQSLDTIVNTGAEIGESLPEFKEFGEMFGENEHMREVLALFFQDILDFYLVTVKFFNMKRWQYHLHLLPRRMEKIKDITKNIRHHTELLRRHVNNQHIREARQARRHALEESKKAEAECRSQEYERIRASVSPVFYDRKLAWCSERICEGTGKWLLREQAFKSWLDIGDNSTPLLWLQGMPGSGKTFLSGTVIRKAMSSGPVAFAFVTHDQQNGSKTALAVLHSLIFQLAESSPGMQVTLSESVKQNLSNDISVAVQLLETLLNCAGPCYIVLDGLDETEEVERQRLIFELLKLTQACKETKFMFASRPEHDLVRLLRGKASEMRVDEKNAGSIQAFVNWRREIFLAGSVFSEQEKEEVRGLLSPLASNAQGMFLYAEIMLRGIEHLDVKELREELKVLPESLDEAYVRIIERINRLHNARAKGKAKKILGLVVCSPVPMSVQELEQALVVSTDDFDPSCNVASLVDIVKLCGPILEVVDDFVRLVHFTAKEYLLLGPPRGLIRADESLLVLAKCCISYLCKNQYDRDLPEESIREYVATGAYRLDNYATTLWLSVVEQYARQKAATLSDELRDLVEELRTERFEEETHDEMLKVERSDEERPVENRVEGKKSVRKSNNESNEVYLGYGLGLMAEEWPETRELLVRAAKFRQDISALSRPVKSDDLSAPQYPLSTWKISAAVDKAISDLRSPETLIRHYGKRPFRCGFLNCGFRRRGFATKAQRDTHEKYHDHPWKCEVEDCEYARIGFLSRGMKCHHQETAHCLNSPKSHSRIMESGFSCDNDELLPFLFDLIKSDRVKDVKVLLASMASNSLGHGTHKELVLMASSLGSVDMLEILNDHMPLLLNERHDRSIIAKYIAATLRHSNFAAFRWYVTKITERKLPKFWDINETLQGYLESTCIPSQIQREVMANLATLAPDSERSLSSLKFCRHIYSRVIKATRDNPEKEQKLNEFWNEFLRQKTPKTRVRVIWLSNMLKLVSETTCSVVLARELLALGAPIDHVSDSRLGGGSTPLRFAARQITREAAEFVEFLLYQGADPNHRGRQEPYRGPIASEEGAKRISGWLNRTFEDIVKDVEAKRG